MLALLLLVAGGCARQTKRQLQGEVTEPKVRVGRITFEGNRTFPTKLLKSRLRLKEGADFDDFLFQEDKRKLKGFYRRNGFLEMKLSTRSRFDPKTGWLDHTFVIAEGVQTRTRSVGVEVRPQLAGVTDQDLFDVITLKAKAPLNLTAVDLSKYAILNLYANKGYLYAEVDTAVVRDTVAHEADVTFIVAEGHQVRVGTLNIRYSAIDSNAPPPKPRVRRGIIERELTLHPGDVLSAEKLYESQQRVYATGLFKNVKFEQQGREEKRDTVNLILWIEEEKLHYVGFGVGYQSPDLGQVSPEWGHDNLFNNGQQLALRSILAYGFTLRNGAHDYRQNYDVSYTEPKFLSSSFRGIAHAFYNKERLTNRIKPDTTVDKVHKEPYDSTTALTQTGGEARLERSFGGHVQISFGYRNVYVIEGKNTTSSLVAAISKDGRNDFFNPTKGGVASLTSEAAGGILKGGNDFVRTVADASLMVTPFPRLTLGGHLKVGAIKGYGRTRTVPVYEAFKLGGGTSIRGYEEGSIFVPLSILGNSESLIQGNLEARIPLFDFPLPPYGLISTVVFGDGGNIWPGFASTTWQDAKYGYGVGLRYFTPIGPARLDFGWPAMKSTRIDSFEVYISLGHAF